MMDRYILPGTPFLITPSDTEAMKDAGGRNITATGIAIGTAGALSLVTIEGHTVIIPSGVLSTGIVHPIRFRRVNLTGTTATNIVGFKPGDHK